MSPLGAPTAGSTPGKELAVTASPSAAAAAAGALAGCQGSPIAVNAAGTSAGGASSLQGSINLQGHVAGSEGHTAEQPRGPRFIRAGVSSLLGILRRSPLPSPQSSPRAADDEALLQQPSAPLAITQVLSQHLAPSASAWNAARSLTAGATVGTAAPDPVVEVKAAEPAAATAPPEPKVEVTAADMAAEVEAPALADKNIPPVDSNELQLLPPRPSGDFLDLLHVASQPAEAGISAGQSMQPELAGLGLAGRCGVEQPGATALLRHFSSDIPPTQVVFIPSQPEADAEAACEWRLEPADAGAAASSEAEHNREMDRAAEVKAQCNEAAELEEQLDEAEEMLQPPSQGIAAAAIGATGQQHEDQEMPDAGICEPQQVTALLSSQQQPCAEFGGEEHEEQQLQEALGAEEAEQVQGMSNKVPLSQLGPLPPSEPLLPPLGTEALLDRVEPTPAEPCASLLLTTVQSALGAMEAAALTPEDAAQAAELAAAVAGQRHAKAAAAAAGCGGEVTSPAKSSGGGDDEGMAEQQQEESADEPTGQQLGSNGTAAAPSAAAALAPLTQVPDLLTQAQFEGFAFPRLTSAAATDSLQLVAPLVQPSSPAQTPAAAQTTAQAGGEDAGGLPEAVRRMRRMHVATLEAGFQTRAAEDNAAGVQTAAMEMAEAGVQTVVVKQTAAGMQTAATEDVGAQTVAIQAATTGVQASRVLADAGIQTACMVADAGLQAAAQQHHPQRSVAVQVCMVQPVSNAQNDKKQQQQYPAHAPAGADSKPAERETNCLDCLVSAAEISTIPALVLASSAGAPEVAMMVAGKGAEDNEGAAEVEDAVPQRLPEASALVAQPVQPMTQEPTLEELPLGPLPDLSVPIHRPSGRLVAVREIGFGGIVHVMRAPGPPPTATSPDQQALAAIAARQAARREATRQVEEEAERAAAEAAVGVAEATEAREAAGEQEVGRSEDAGQQAGRKRSRPWESRPPPPSVLAARAKIQRLASERRYRAALAAAASPGPPEELPALGATWRPATGPPGASPPQARVVQRLLREEAAALHRSSPLLQPSPVPLAGAAAAAQGGTWRPSAGPPGTGLAQRRLSGDELLVDQQHATGLVTPGAGFGGQQVASAARPPPPGLSARKLNPLAAAALRSVEWTGGWQQQQQ